MAARLQLTATDNIALEPDTILGRLRVRAVGLVTAASLAAPGAAGGVGFDALEPADPGSVAERLKRIVYADEHTTLQAAIDEAYGSILLLTSGATYSSSNLTINEDIEIGTTGTEPATISTPTNSGTAISVGLSVAAAATTTLAANARLGERFIQVTSATGLAVGQLLQFVSNKAWYYDAREALAITTPADAAGAAVSGTTTTMVLEVGTTFTGFVGMAFTIESGTNAGFARAVTAYNSGTRTVTFAALPAAIDATSNYRFPQLVKGETHMIKGIVGTTVELVDQLLDGYDVVDDSFGDGKEIVTLIARTPLKFTIDNVFVNRPALNGANSFLLKISNCARHRVTRFGGINGTASGIQELLCYGGRMSKLDIANANDTTTGYGVQVYGSTFSTVTDSDFRNCRRGIDLSGPMPSSYPTATWNRIHGGGAQEDAQAYTPTGTVENFGIGTHSTCRGATIAFNRITNVSRAINLRGRDEKVLFNEFFGQITLCCVDLGFGMNRLIKGNVYGNGYSEGTLSNGQAKTETKSFAATNINNVMPPQFIRIQTTIDRGFIDVSDNVCWGVQNFFICFTGAMTCYDLSLRNNKAFFAPNQLSDECALIGAAGAVDLINLRMASGNEFIGSESLTNLLRLGTNVEVGQVAGVASRMGEAYTDTVYAADDTVAKIRVGQKGAQLRFDVFAENSTGFVFSGMLAKAATTMVSFGLQANVLGLATVPAGTTGTDGRVNCHFDGNWLYLENRSGGVKNFYVTIHPMR